MTYREFLRMADAVFATGCGTCGGGGKVGGSQNRDCPACGGSGQSATESRGR